MARRKPKTRRQAGSSRARRTPVQGGGPTAAPEPVETASPELAETYGYVRRDLIRIAVLAVSMFALILASPLLLR